MSVIERFLCCTRRLFLVQSNTRRGFFRHFNRKSKLFTEKKTILEQPIIKKNVKVNAEGRLQSLNLGQNATLGKFCTYAAVFVPSCFLACMIWTNQNTNRGRIEEPVRTDVDDQKKPSLADLKDLWNGSSRGMKIFVGVMAANAFVYGMWKNSTLTRTMARYFVTMPSKNVAAASLTLAGFSHKTQFHLLANMFGLWWFVDGSLQSMNVEQLMAVFLTGITLSSLASCCYKVVTGRMFPSSGALGGIFALISLACFQKPDAEISSPFVPHSLTAKSAILGVMAFDCLGMLMKWKMIDHAGQLGGALFGLFYATYGQHKIWEKNCSYVGDYWKKLKESISSVSISSKS